jgi:hypothetical protein
MHFAINRGLPFRFAGIGIYRIYNFIITPCKNGSSINGGEGLVRAVFIAGKAGG